MMNNFHGILPHMKMGMGGGVILSDLGDLKFSPTSGGQGGGGEPT